MSVYLPITNLIHQHLDNLPPNRLNPHDEYLHLRTFHSLDQTMDNLLLGSSSLKMGTTEDTRRRQNTGLSRVISNRVKGMGNNKEADNTALHPVHLILWLSRTVSSFTPQTSHLK
jgi:hypothetical protein